MEQTNSLGKNTEYYSSKLLEARITTNFITIPQTTINYKELLNNLSAYNQVKYAIIKLEQHKDEGYHIHIVIKTKQQVKLKSIHNIIISTPGEIKGTINYQKPEKINATIQYLKKTLTEVDGEPYLEYGETPLDQGISKKNNIDTNNQEILVALALAKEGKTEEALEHIMNTNPDKYLLYKNTIINTLEETNKTRLKYDLPDMSMENVKLSEHQEKIWNLLQGTPKQRRIIWVTGAYGSGKSFLYNYIKKNHLYRMYDAGSTASLDNIAYGYDEEGVIAWDLPKAFNFTDYGDAIAAVIEKFSDFGQSITSKKYNGKTQNVRGHVIVFSNNEPIKQLKHRDIIHIDLTNGQQEEEQQEEEY